MIPGLERADRADAENPRHAELFHRPHVGAVIQLAGQDAMAASVAREKHHVAPGEPAGEELIAGRAERSFDRNPFLVREPFDVVKPAAADDADAMVCHTLRRSCNGRRGIWPTQRRWPGGARPWTGRELFG